ncbi:uncharacterized protein K02A2.6-like [Uranotaenia lowii]|uniref:uncharacterized protein K02A2.6-like n=1 Tax=Uranotaenia lowii TaxID=190385 RepID=UPI00247B2BBC|nr:uncharacterized protein K02A2.6-like [Uranotaenia lowii]
MKGTSASKTIDALETIFNEHAYPESIRCDNGPPFSSDEFSEYCLKKNVRLIKCIPYWPQMNGLVERQNQGILKTLRIAKATKSDWKKAIKEYVYMHNTTPNSVTGKAPLELMTGRPVKDMLPSLRTERLRNKNEEISDRDAILKMKGKLYADARRQARPSDIKKGDIVMMRNFDSGKLEPSFHMEKFEVVGRNGSDVCIQNEAGVRYRRSVTHLKKWPAPLDDNSKSVVVQKPEAETIENEADVGNDLDYEQFKRKSGSDDEHDQEGNRPKRSRKLPARFLD